MSTPLIGVSSSTLAHRSASDLLEAATAIGADCLDLRAGRNQGWEPDLAIIADRMPISFVGIGDTLGHGHEQTEAAPEMIEELIKRDIPLRVFPGPLDTADAVRRFRDDTARVRDRWGSQLRLIVEPHTDAPTLSQLDDVLSQEKIGAVVDILGLLRLNVHLDEAKAFLKRHGIAVQVKGIGLQDGKYRHIAIRSAPPLLSWIVALLDGVQLPVSVETKAGTAKDDITVIRAGLADPQTFSLLPVQKDLSACVLAL